jgi:DNA-binding XRE family transcriptional regulator
MHKFKEIRKRLGLRQAEMAEILGCAGPNLSHIERGNQIPTIILSKKLMAYCKQKRIKVTLDEIYKDVVV